MNHESPPDWASLVDVARWAPSPHNTQPWKVRPIDATTADLFMVRSRTLPDEDTTGHFLNCAMGIFIEALRIAAAEAGWSLEVEPLGVDAEGAELIPFARLGLRRGATTPRFGADVLRARRTSRLSTEARAIEPGVGDRLSAVASACGHNLRIATDPMLIESMLEENVRAVFHDLNIGAYRRELARWYRLTEAHAARASDGLSAPCFNLPALEMWLSTRAPWLMRTPVVSPLLARLYRRRLGACHAMLFLSGPFFARADAERAGAMLLRLWLEMHDAGLTIHPFGNLVTNEHAHASVAAAVGNPDVWLVARVGFTAPPPRSERLRTEAILCSVP
ncbi:MAG: hypothetical protein IT434_15445 [Phycisphaerales bacterium]|nr:hypothetical protein [Phycisphaerales bacterium]